MSTESDPTIECGLTRIDNAWTCERCDHVFVGDHYSAEHCNETGRDVTLCYECCELADGEAKARAGAGQPLQPLVTDDSGVLRFRANAIIRWAVDNRRLDLNEIACLPGIPDVDRCQLAQLIGYSVSGYGDLSYVDGTEWARVQASIGTPKIGCSLTQTASEVFDFLTDSGTRIRHNWDGVIAGAYDRAMSIGAPKGLRAGDCDRIANGSKMLALHGGRLYAVDGGLGFDITADIRRAMELDEITP